MKCTRAGASVLRIAVMVMAPLICTNKYDNLSIKLVTTAVRMPRVWDESCKKKETELYWWYKIYPHDENQKLLFPELALFLRLDHTSIATFSKDYSNTPNYLEIEERGLRLCSNRDGNVINLRFPSSSELKIHPFQIVVVQGGQRNLRKSVRHV